MKKKELTTEPLRILFEGDPGAGKTRLADSSNSSPETSPALHLDLRGNTITLGVVPGDHYVIDVETIDDLRNIYNWLAKGQSEDDEIASWFPGVTFRTVILDTLTQYHNMALDKITGNQQKQIGMPTKQPQIQDWGELLRQTVLLMSKLGELPLHVIITVQSSETQDNITGQILHRPQLWGKSVKEVPAFVYVHAYILQAARLTKAQRLRMGLADDLPAETRVAMFTPRFDSMAKDQYGVLGPHMVDPSIDKMCKLIYPKGSDA